MIVIGLPSVLSTLRFTVLWGSALIVITGLLLFEIRFVVVRTGFTGAVISNTTVNIIDAESADSFPAASVEVTVITLSPSSKVIYGNEKVLLSTAVAVTDVATPFRYRVIRLPASAVPLIV